MFLYHTDATNQKPDFYHSPWVSETRECVPLLHKVKESTNAMLEQWPDFPTLKEVRTMNRCLLKLCTSNQPNPSPIMSPLLDILVGNL